MYLDKGKRVWGVGERVKLSNAGWTYLKGGGHFDLRPWEFEKNTSWRMGSVEAPPHPYPGDVKDLRLFIDSFLGLRRLTASDFRKGQTEILGDVVGVRSNGYFIKWDGEEKDAWVPDKYVAQVEEENQGMNQQFG